jgi:hypothetical protein
VYIVFPGTASPEQYAVSALICANNVAASRSSGNALATPRIASAYARSSGARSARGAAA